MPAVVRSILTEPWYVVRARPVSAHPTGPNRAAVSGSIRLGSVTSRNGCTDNQVADQGSILESLAQSQTSGYVGFGTLPDLL